MLGSQLHVCRAGWDGAERNRMMGESLHTLKSGRRSNHPQRESGLWSCRFRSRSSHRAVRCLKCEELQIELRKWGWPWQGLEVGVHYAYAPLYQNMLPNSWGPCIILQVRLMSLPVFTIRSGGPKISALSSAKKKWKGNKREWTKSHLSCQVSLYFFFWRNNDNNNNVNDNVQLHVCSGVGGRLYFITQTRVSIMLAISFCYAV